MTNDFIEMKPVFSPEHLEALSKVLGDTTDGLKGSQIDDLLRNCNFPNPTPDLAKWKRLYNAFVEVQNNHQDGACILRFIERAMTPALYVREEDLFRSRRDTLNEVLAFSGFILGEDGKIITSTPVQTIQDAVERSNRLRYELQRRNVHLDVLESCRSELLTENYFHAVFEAMKSITAKVRTLSGLSGDGSELVYRAFSQKNGGPLLKINDFLTETEKGEQAGFINLLNGLYGTIRNPLAHPPKTEWNMTEQDTLDILTMISLVHRKLDQVPQRVLCKK
jgi:uncharacterized protein (TIGR02391 family)